MTRILIVLTVLITTPLFSQAADLRGFLKACAWGTVGGAAAGVVSLAFEDKPSDSWNNVARGASLGLYAGIGYGLYKINNPDVKAYSEPDFAVFPTIRNGKVEGIQVAGVLFDF